MIVQNRLSEKPAEVASGISRREEASQVGHLVAALIVGLLCEM
jgi:hypothetical protein